MSVTLYLAIPCYNEAAVLPETARRLREKFTVLRAAGTIGPMSRICFIDDGSKDATWQLISDLHARDPVFSGIRLSRNRGHQNALLCGLMPPATERGRLSPVWYPRCHARGLSERE